MLKNKTVAFMGAGNMAEAMISGTVQSGKLSRNQIIVSNRSDQQKRDQIESLYGVRTMGSEELPFDEIDVLILAMKPKDIDTVLDAIKYKVHNKTVIMSVLAGITTSHMEQNLPAGQSVIRVMPNTSSMLKESATAISAGRFTTEIEMEEARELLSTIGQVFVIQEEQMDIFTGVAGSGPAYFYYLMEHIEKTATESGLSPEVAREIGAQTIYGAAKMMLERNESPTELRENVTSPNGTTAAGLRALDENGGGKAISAAVKGAQKRSAEISSSLKQKQLVSQ
ncbi:pyrroline-5-carboxylate reductase [Rossellomorea marisflavi]